MKEKKKIPVAIIVSIFNEEKTIEELLEAFNAQTVQPEEIIFIDASLDEKTFKKIRDFNLAKDSTSGAYMQRGGTNRSQARNIGIEQAFTEIVVITDAGCIPKADWLEKISQPFFDDPKTEVVAGFYDPDPQNQFEEIVANTTSVRTWNFNKETFLPSSRSVAFTKKIWKKVGKYDEKLSHNEDLPFAELLKKEAKHWIVQPEAQVIWRQPKSLSELMNKLYRYALGDLEAKHERHAQKIRSALWRIGILLCVALPLLFMSIRILQFLGIGLIVLYIVGSWMKHRRVIRNPLFFLLTPIIQLSVDISLCQAWIEFQIAKISHSPFSQST